MAGRLPRSVWIPLVALSLVIFGWRLNSVPLTNWDEGIYANVSLELFRSQDWSNLTYFGADFLEKPPLQFWVTSALFGIIGPTELAVRILPALAGVATSLLLALWTFQVTRQRWVALAAGTMFVLGHFALVHAFRTGDLDGLLTFFITLALYGYWRSWTRPRWIIVWGAASAAAVMTKSLVGLLPLMIVGLDILLSRGWKKIGWANIGLAVGTFVALAAPWHIVETVRFGRAFWDSYLGVHVIERTTESLFTATPWHYYLGVIRDRFAPFSWFLPLALLLAIWRWWKEKNELGRLLVGWFVVTLMIFSFIQTRREWYILPLYPGAVLLTATTIMTWWQASLTRWLQAAVVISLLGAFGHLLAEHYFRQALSHFSLLRELTTPFWRTIGGQLLFGAAGIALLALVAVILRRWRGNRWRWFLGLSGGAITLAALMVSLLYIKTLPKTLPLKTIATRIEQEKVQTVSLIGTRLKKQPAGYFYILRMDTQSAEYEAGTPPLTPLVLTTIEDKNSPLNTRGRVVLRQSPFLLLDLR